MDGPQFDGFARALATGRSRRRLFGQFARLGGGLAGGGIALHAQRVVAAQGNGNEGNGNGNGNENGNGGNGNGNGNGNNQGPACREEGHPCEGNQVCCEGLVCEPSGPGAADRCTAARTEPPTECEGECPEEAVTVEPGRGYRVEADCAYDEGADETTCSCAASAAEGGGEITAVRVPVYAAGALVVGGEVELDCAGDVRLAAYASTSASFTVVFLGNVTAETLTTWWCETGGELIPASGPMLVAKAADDVSDSAGAVVVHASACEGTPGEQDPADWHRECTAPAPERVFVLERDGEPVDAAGKQTNRGGMVRYGQLPTGAYRLSSSEGAWCHAECDNVDEQGEVVVEAGRRTQVWVFYCGEGTG